MDGVTSVFATLHGRHVYNRRVRVLADHLAAIIPRKATVLDVGCGDGTIDYVIAQRRSDVSIQGIDVLVRPNARIPVESFDGVRIPYSDASFDVVMFVDVLHHTSEPKALLKEASRVAKEILIKDHFREGLLANATLRFMDWVGNAHHGVALPYNYWSKSEWNSVWEELALRPSQLNLFLGLYPMPACWVFERGLHFIAKFERVNPLDPIGPRL